MSLPTNPSRRGLPYRTRLLVSALLGAVPLIALGLILLVSWYGILRASVLRGNLAQAELAAATLEGWVRGNIGTLRTLKQAAEVQREDHAEIQALVLRQLRVQPEWDNLFVTDAAGREIASNRPRAFVGRIPIFLQAKRTRQPVVSNIIYSPVTGQPVVVIIHPILRNGDFRGIIGVVIRPRVLQNLLTRVPLDPTTQIQLWGSDHRLIAGTHLATSLIGRQFSGPLLAAILSRHSGTVHTQNPITGESMLYGYAPVHESPWALATGTAYSVALQPIYRLLAIYILLALLVLGATILWSVYSSSMFARQIAQLVEGARAIGVGKLDTVITLHTGSELDELAQSLTKMAADLAILDQLKSDLLTMVSHELKTPLTAILTALDIITSDLVPPNDPHYRETLGIAVRQARHLQAMIENLMNVARLQAGSLAVEPRPTSLAAIVKAALEPYRDLIRQHGLLLDVEVSTELRVMADAPKITLVISNLLDNAVKFTKAGSITVRARTEGRFAVVTVTDTGAGIAPEALSQLFERFYQAEPLLTRRVGGFGLGLWVVRAIVQAHGGEVFAQSAGAGQGSTFGITLPLADDG